MPDEALNEKVALLENALREMLAMYDVFMRTANHAAS